MEPGNIGSNERTISKEKLHRTVAILPEMAIDSMDECSDQSGEDSSPQSTTMPMMDTASAPENSDSTVKRVKKSHSQDCVPLKSRELNDDSTPRDSPHSRKVVSVPQKRTNVDLKLSYENGGDQRKKNAQNMQKYSSIERSIKLNDIEKNSTKSLVQRSQSSSVIINKDKGTIVNRKLSQTKENNFHRMSQGNIKVDNKQADIEARNENMDDRIENAEDEHSKKSAEGNDAIEVDNEVSLRDASTQDKSEVTMMEDNGDKEGNGAEGDEITEKENDRTVSSAPGNEEDGVLEMISEEKENEGVISVLEDLHSEVYNDVTLKEDGDSADITEVSKRETEAKVVDGEESIVVVTEKETEFTLDDESLRAEDGVLVGEDYVGLQDIKEEESDQELIPELDDNVTEYMFEKEISKNQKPEKFKSLGLITLEDENSEIIEREVADNKIEKDDNVEKESILKENVENNINDLEEIENSKSTEIVMEEERDKLDKVEENNENIGNKEVENNELSVATNVDDKEKYIDAINVNEETQSREDEEKVIVEEMYEKDDQEINADSEKERQINNVDNSSSMEVSGTGNLLEEDLRESTMDVVIENERVDDTKDENKKSEVEDESVKALKEEMTAEKVEGVENTLIHDNVEYQKDDSIHISESQLSNMALPNIEVNDSESHAEDISNSVKKSSVVDFVKEDSDTVQYIEIENNGRPYIEEEMTEVVYAEITVNTVASDGITGRTPSVEGSIDQSEVFKDEDTKHSETQENTLDNASKEENFDTNAENVDNCILVAHISRSDTRNKDEGSLENVISRSEDIIGENTLSVISVDKYNETEEPSTIERSRRLDSKQTFRSEIEGQKMTISEKISKKERKVSSPIKEMPPLKGRPNKIDEPRKSEELNTDNNNKSLSKDQKSNIKMDIKLVKRLSLVSLQNRKKVPLTKRISDVTPERNIKRLSNESIEVKENMVNKSDISEESNQEDLEEKKDFEITEVMNGIKENSEGELAENENMEDKNDSEITKVTNKIKENGGGDLVDKEDPEGMKVTDELIYDAEVEVIERQIFEEEIKKKEIQLEESVMNNTENLNIAECKTESTMDVSDVRSEEVIVKNMIEPEGILEESIPSKNVSERKNVPEAKKGSLFGNDILAEVKRRLSLVEEIRPQESSPTFKKLKILKRYTSLKELSLERRLSTQSLVGEKETSSKEKDVNSIKEESEENEKEEEPVQEICQEESNAVSLNINKELNVKDVDTEGTPIIEKERYLEIDSKEDEKERGEKLTFEDESDIFEITAHSDLPAQAPIQSDECIKDEGIIPTEDPKKKEDLKMVVVPENNEDAKIDQVAADLTEKVIVEAEETSMQPVEGEEIGDGKEKEEEIILEDSESKKPWVIDSWVCDAKMEDGKDDVEVNDRADVESNESADIGSNVSHGTEEMKIILKKKISTTSYKAIPVERYMAPTTANEPPVIDENRRPIERSRKKNIFVLYPEKKNTAKTEKPVVRSGHGKTLSPLVLPRETGKKREKRATTAPTDKRHPPGQTEKETETTMPVFQSEIGRIKSHIEEMKVKIQKNKKERKEFVPYVFNSLQPYGDTNLYEGSRHQSPRTVSGSKSRITAIDLCDPWENHRMDLLVLPALKETSSLVTSRSQQRSSHRHNKENGTPSHLTQDSKTKTPVAKGSHRSQSHEGRQKISSSRKIDEDYRRTRTELYRLSLDKLNRTSTKSGQANIRSALFAYLQNSPGSKKALYEVVRHNDRSKVTAS